MRDESRGIQTLDGGHFSFDHPRALPIEVNARALSRLARWTGHTLWFLSVAQHSVIVSRLVDRRLAAAALLHDAAEAIIGDINTPLKRAIGEHDGGFLRDLENRIHAVILDGLGVARPTKDDELLIKRADEDALGAEIRDCMRPGERPLLDRGLITVAHVPHIRRGWNPDEAEARFLERWYEVRP
jgi:hypothetical protein